MHLYEVLFRPTTGGCHKKYIETTQLGDVIGAPEPVIGADVEAVIGELCTSLAEQVAAKDAQIAELRAQVAAKDVQIAELTK